MQLIQQEKLFLFKATLDIFFGFFLVFVPWQDRENGLEKFSWIFVL